MNKKDEIIIFTDGASRGNPGPGGYGTIVVYPPLDEVVELGGGKPKTTNNEMELSAIVSAFAYIASNSSSVKVFTDSKYAINGITKWVENWKKNDWMTQDKKPVSHKELWETLSNLIADRTGVVEWIHLPGHSGVIGNEQADKIATQFADGKNYELYRGNLAGYGIDILNIDIDQIKLKQKKDREKRATGKAYSYLSVVDGELEKHETWAECEARVKGKKAQFKKSLSPEHEAEILHEWGFE